MGLFGFGKKKNKADKAEAKVEDEDVKAAKAANVAAKADSELAQHTAAAALPEAASDYEGRGDERGPWDVNDENVPDYDEYLDLGAYYLPFLAAYRAAHQGVPRHPCRARIHHHLLQLQP